MSGQFQFKDVTTVSKEERSKYFKELAEAFTGDDGYEEISQGLKPVELIKFLNKAVGSEDNAKFYLVTDNLGRLVAFVAWTLRFFLPKDIYSIKTYVLPQYRHKGLGTAAATAGFGIVPQDVKLLMGVHPRNQVSYKLTMKFAAGKPYPSTEGYVLVPMTKASADPKVKAEIDAFQATLSPTGGDEDYSHSIVHKDYMREKHCNVVTLSLKGKNYARLFLDDTTVRDNEVDWLTKATMSFAGHYNKVNESKTPLVVGSFYVKRAVPNAPMPGYPEFGLKVFKQMVVGKVQPTDPKALIVALLAMSLDDSVNNQEAQFLLQEAYNNIDNSRKNIKGLTSHNATRLGAGGYVQNVNQILFRPLNTQGQGTAVRFPAEGVLGFRHMVPFCFGIARGNLRNNLKAKDIFTTVLQISALKQQIGAGSVDNRELFEKLGRVGYIFSRSAMYVDEGMSLEYLGALRALEAAGRLPENKSNAEYSNRGYVTATCMAIRAIAEYEPQGIGVLQSLGRGGNVDGQAVQKIVSLIANYRNPH